MPKPKIFVNKIDREIKNNSKSYHFTKDNNNNDNRVIPVKDNISIISKINSFFNSDDFVYKLKVNIILNNGNSITDEIIALKDNELITLSGNKIKVKDISDIKKAN